MRDRAAVWIGVVGFGLAAQFDSFVLHRMLKWHHLLSSIRPEATEAMHELADAGFDAAMTAILLAGLLGLLAHRRALPELALGVAGGAALSGFGLWHLVDAVVVHGLLRLHRIHAASPHPLFWDIAWPAVFGLFPLVLGVPMLRGRPAADASGVQVPAGIPAGTVGTSRRSPGTRRQRKGPPS